jgi:signal transduction histidine kinase/ActR/RegA family two-component response regulator
MGWAETFEQAVLSRRQAQDRMTRMFAYLCVAATACGLTAATMTWGYGYGDAALKIYLAAATLPLALLLLRWIDDWQTAGHYLAANILLQTMLFAPDASIGCIVLAALAAGVALFRANAARFWLAVIVVRCIYVAVNASDELGSATAAVAAFVAAATFGVVQIIEASRRRSSRMEKVAVQQTAGQLAALSQLVNEHFDGYMIVIGDDIHTVGSSIEQFLGYSPNVFKSNPLSFYLHPDETRLVTQLEPGAKPARHEFRMRHADGRWVWVEGYAVADVLHGRHDRMVFAFRNFDSQRKVSDQLTQAQRLESMGTMAAAVSHDFNNMLTVIMGMADELPDGQAKSEIARVASNAAALTSKLLAFGHGQKASTEVHDLSHVMQEHSLLLRHMLDSTYVLFEDYIDKPVLVRIDESQFEQVLVNLVNNAREAMGDGGDLEITLALTEFSRHSKRNDAPGSYAVLEVKDSGRGMSPEVQAKIFDPFFSTKEKRANSGLGLSSVYGIVAQYGGFIDIDSQEGVGTSVKVYLPIAEDLDHEPVLELVTSSTSILVIDDDPGVVRVIKSALNRAGYHVIGCTTPQTAIDAFSTGKIALVITDVVMTGMSGADLASRFRAKAPDLPILFVSGFTNAELNSWETNQVTQYLAKPFRGEEVVARVERLLDGKKLKPDRKALG